MAYGLQVRSFDAGGNPIVQIDTQLGLTNYVVTQSGRASTLTLNTTPKDRIIFVKPIDNNPVYILGLLGNSGTVQFVTDDYYSYTNDQKTWNNAYMAQDVDYMVVEDVTGTTPVGDYGLQVKQSNGDIAFDSRCIINNYSFEITSVIPRGASNGYSDILTTDLNSYVSFNWSEWRDLGDVTGIQKSTQGIRYISVSEDEGPFDDPREDITYYYPNYTNILIANKV